MSDTISIDDFQATAHEWLAANHQHAPRDEQIRPIPAIQMHLIVDHGNRFLLNHLQLQFS